MPIQVHNPVADWINAGWSLVGAGVTALWQALSVVDDLKYIICPGSKSGAAVTFPIDTTSVPEGAVITSITVKIRCSTGVGSAPPGVAPSVTVAVAAQDNPSRYFTRTIYPTSTISDYEVATYTRDALGLAWDVFRLNYLFINIFTYIAIYDLIRCHRLYCEINYRVRPIITVTDPSGTVSTPSPRIEWSYAQADGDPQKRARYRIFTADQVADVAFDAGTTVPVYENAVDGPTLSKIIPTSLNPNTYWVYVQSESSFGALSTWVGRQFVVDGTAPGTPGVEDPNVIGDSVISVVPDVQTGAAALQLRDTSNLLTSQEADAESAIDGHNFVASNCSIARGTSVAFPGTGSASWQLTATAGGDVTVYTDWVELDPNEQTDITARAQFMADSDARTVTPALEFFDSAFAEVAGSEIVGTASTSPTGSWAESAVSGSTPSAAQTQYVRARFVISGAASSEVHSMDRVGVMYGSNIQWSDGSHASRNLLPAWYASPQGTPGAGEGWSGGTATSVDAVAVTGTGSSGTTCNRMTYDGLSPTLGYRAAGSAFNSVTSGNNFTLNKPAGTVSGDLMVAFVTCNEQTSLNVVPAGWTLVDTISVDDGSTDTCMIILKRSAGGSEPASWTDGTLNTSPNRRTAVVVGYSGAADASQQFLAESSAATGSGTPPFLTVPAVNNTDPNAWRISAFGLSDNASGGSMTANQQAPAVVPAISFVSNASFWGTYAYNENVYSINRPPNMQAGDLMVATASFISYVTVTPPSGWTVRWQDNISTQGGYMTMAIMTKVATGSDPSSWSGTISGTLDRRIIVQCSAYRNVDTSGNPFVAQNGNTYSSNNPIVTPSVTNTNSSAWRLASFANLTTNISGISGSNEVIQRTNGYADYGTGTLTCRTFDSNGTVSSGTYARQITSSASNYASAAWLGFLKPLSAPPSPIANETARALAQAGSSNPWMTTRVFDSNGSAEVGSQSLTGIWSQADRDSMVGWQAIIRPAAAATSGYTLATMDTNVDLSNLDLDLVPGSSRVTVSSAFLGSTSGTPYLTAHFYRANVLLKSLVQEGSTFGSSVWAKSAVVFDVPEGTTRIGLSVSASDRQIGDLVYWDRVLLAFGEDPVWRGGTSRDEHPVWASPQVQFADDDGTGYTDWADLPGLRANPPEYLSGNGVAYYTDHTPVPLTNRKYRARTVSIGLNGDQFVSDWCNESSEFSFVAENWWLKDIEDPSNNIQLLVKWGDVSVSTSNTAATFQPLGEELPVVLTEGYKGESFSLDLIPLDRAKWVSLSKMLKSGRTLFLQSDVDHAWWVRPIGDLQSNILATGKRQSNPLRSIKCQFIEVTQPE